MYVLTPDCRIKSLLLFCLIQTGNLINTLLVEFDGSLAIITIFVNNVIHKSKNILTIINLKSKLVEIFKKQ